MAKKAAKKPVQAPQKQAKPIEKPEPEPVITPEPPQPTQSNLQPTVKKKSVPPPSNRARLLWKTFEAWALAQQDSMNAECVTLATTMDTLWRSTPKQHRDSQRDLDKRKADQRRQKQTTFYEEMRNEWQKRLADAGLKDEDWDDITEEEGMAVMKLLGADLDDEEPVVVDVPVPASGGTRSTNVSADYDIVNASSFQFDIEAEAFDITSFNDDTNSEASASNPWAWESEASGYNTVNTETPQSSSHSSPKLSSDKLTLGGFVKVPSNRSPPPHSVTKTSEKKKPGRYLGPEIVDYDDQSQDDEADFASFKMDMRILKIREYHAEAVEADIALARKVAQAKSKNQLHDLVAAHELQMSSLQERKEIERKALVEAERQKRKKAIRERSYVSRPVPVPSRTNLFGESDLGDLPSQVVQKESKPVRKKKPSPANDTSSLFSQETIRRKITPPPEDFLKDDWNPFNYDINALLANIPQSMPPPIGSSSSTDPATKQTRPAPASRTQSSSSRVTGHEFWVPPSKLEVEQTSVPPEKGKAPAKTSATTRRETPQVVPTFIPATKSTTDATFQTQGATSSKTTLEDIRPAAATESRSFWVPPTTMSRASSSTSAVLSTAGHPHEIWLPPQQSNAPRTRTVSSSARRPPDVPVASPQILKSQSMPQGEHAVADNKRVRRMSDPVSPSPRIFSLPEQSDQNPPASYSAGILKKLGTAGSQGKRATVEDVPDDEDDNAFEHLPSDSKYIMEPRPMVPPAMFDQILDYEETSSSPQPKAGKTSVTDWNKVMEDKAARAKHVRWTPSVVGGSPVSLVVPDNGSRKAGEVNMEKKGKGRVTESSDDLSRCATEALAGLKKARKKAV